MNGFNISAMRFISAYFLLLLLLGGCENFSVKDQTGSNGQADDFPPMTQLLQDLITHANPEENNYLNDLRARHFWELTEKADHFQKSYYRNMLAIELLSSGRSVDAITQFELLYTEQAERIGNRVRGMDKAKRDELIEGMIYFEKFLAISHLRKGEQENCIENHSPESCIFPLQEGGIHQIRSGSESAKIYYTKLLKNDSTDLESRWLLNIAYMTLGEYPEGVPSQWLIPQEAFASDYPLARFNDIAGHLGLDVNGLLGGSIMEDLDGDGYLDIMASSWGIRDQLKYFKNNGDGTFTDMTQQAGLRGILGGINMVHGDYNNDGFPDIFVLRGAWLYQYGNHPNSLLKNNGDGTFTDVTHEAGLLSFQPTQTAAWGDYDNDGWLDLFVGNESTSLRNRRLCELYHNNGDGTFQEVAAECGVQLSAYVKGVVWGDFDNDGKQDLYISCLGAPNILYHNQGENTKGEWSFLNVARKANVAEPIYSFPTWFFDFDNDGWLDIFVSGYQTEQNKSIAQYVAADYLNIPHDKDLPRLYHNDGNGRFSDVTSQAGLDQALYTMGCNYGDLDNDGWLDFYLGTGEPDFRSVIPNRMFRNNQGKTFQDVTTAGGFGHLQKGHGVSFGDLDHDGDQDIYIVLGGALEGDVYRNALFENPGNENHWVKLLFEGKTSNRSAIGTRFSVHIRSDKGERVVHGTVSSGGSFGGSPFRQEIGLGDAELISQIEVFWPASGTKQVFRQVEMNSSYRIVEGEPELIPLHLQPYSFVQGLMHH